ncbi:MAG: hypothetical protein N2D54_12795, partial [Chloroflexota bacterium]
MKEQNIPQFQKKGVRRRIGIFLTILGALLFILGADPRIFNLDQSQVIGFIQVTVFSAGLLIICLGGSICMGTLWPENTMSIAAEIGLRLVWTGYVIALATGMADV